MPEERAHSGGPAAGSWSTRQLAEFISLVARFSGRPEGIERAVERAAEALGADLAALLSENGVVAAAGFPAGEATAAELIAASESPTATMHVPGVGACATASVAVEAEAPHRLLIARSKPQRFDLEETDLIRGMGRVFAVGLRTLGLLESERTRRGMFERLATLQRSIVNRTALPEVLEAVAEGARELLDADVVAIRLTDDEQPGIARLVTSIGASQRLRGRWREARLVDLLSRSVLETGRLVILRSADPEAVEPEFAAEGVRTALVAPLHERGRVAGTLAVGARSPDRHFGSDEEEVVLAFAEHASLALNDARAAEETMHEAFHDSLTGLPNRALFIDRLKHALTRLASGGSPVAVLFCDLDGFKTVNDSLGHAAGDRLLREVASRLGDSLGPADTVARFGGDEFAILLEEMGEPGEAARAAGRLLESLRAPFEVAGREVFVGASIGIAAAAPGAGADEVLRNADLAMYRAKSRGRDRYEIFEPKMHAEVVRRMEMEVDLKRALERDQMIIHYQPIFDLPSGEVAGLEALIRWNHPTAGLIRPNDFVPLAEESGQIRAIGRWVLIEACRQLAMWRAKYPAYDWLYMSVNLSGVQLREPDLVAQVSAALSAADLEPQHLMLEMTETVLMEDTELNASRLEAMRALGVRLAIDDFGTGYSSLEYLNQFPIDALKIAKPFVDRLGGGTGSEAIPRAITDLAEIFGVVVVAEGIERADQPDRLIDLGCRFGQGNHLAPAVERQAADALLFGAGLLGPPSEAERDREPAPEAETEPADG